ncbi:MAG: hypothetical protein EOO17_01010 [Chloroflexi bacterium]|nr:MAG: hypothetical protein EOO17_01010 [Chloroflexota bacterium]
MEIESLARNYQADQGARDVVAASNTLLLVGISGAGKDTIQSKLLKKDGYHKIVTHTTRSPRANNGIMEQDGVEYHFVSHQVMLDMLTGHDLIEVNKYGSNYYGTSVQEFRAANDSGKVTLGNIDVNGITVFKDLGDDAVRALFILPPDYDTWRRRLSARYSTVEEFEHELPNRLQAAADELMRALSVPYYHFIINDDLDRAVRVVDEIAHREDIFNRHDDEARIAARDLLDAITDAARS